MGRSPSTISRELARNCKPYYGGYRAEPAQSYATARRKRSRRGTQFSSIHWDHIRLMIRQRWNPEQLSGSLGVHHDFKFSHETIYRYIRRDMKAGGTLFRFTRGMGKRFRKRYRRPDSRGVMPGKRHFSERPAEVEGREVLGHWEGDTVIGQDQHACILTLVELKSGIAVIKKFNARNVSETNEAAIKAITDHESTSQLLL